MNTQTQEALKQHAEKYGLTLDQFKMMCEGASKTYEGQGMISTDYALAREAYFAGFSKACKEALAQPADRFADAGKVIEPAQEPVVLPPIERDEDMDRTYIPIAGGWEIQTKGKGSTFRICNTKTGERKPVLDEYLQKMLETLAYENRNATHPAPAREPLSNERLDEIVFNCGLSATAKDIARAIEKAHGIGVSDE